MDPGYLQWHYEKSACKSGQKAGVQAEEIQRGNPKEQNRENTGKRDGAKRKGDLSVGKPQNCVCNKKRCGKREKERKNLY